MKLLTFSSILSIILVIAKITGAITLGWWICLMPYLIVIGMKVLFEIFVAIICAIALKDLNEKIDKRLGEYIKEGMEN